MSVVTFSTLAASVKAAKSLHAFLAGDVLANTLVALADVDLETAVRLLPRAGEDATFQLGQVVPLLENAHTKLTRVLGPPHQTRTISMANNLLYKKDVYVLGLLSVCYKYLGNNGRLYDSIELLLSSLRYYKYADPEFFGAMLGLYDALWKYRKILNLPKVTKEDLVSLLESLDYKSYSDDDFNDPYKEIIGPTYWGR
jgi:hypothetical protein